MADNDKRPKPWRTDGTSLIWYTTLAAVLAALLRLFRDSPDSLIWFPLVIAPSALVTAILIRTRGRAWPGIVIGAALGGCFGYAMSRLAIHPSIMSTVQFHLAMSGAASFAGAWAGGGLHAVRLGYRRNGLAAAAMSLIPLALIILSVAASRASN